MKGQIPPPTPLVFPELSISSRSTMSPRASLCLVYEILLHDPAGREEVWRRLCQPVPAARNRDALKLIHGWNSELRAPPLLSRTVAEEPPNRSTILWT